MLPLPYLCLWDENSCLLQSLLQTGLWLPCVSCTERNGYTKFCVRSCSIPAPSQPIKIPWTHLFRVLTRHNKKAKKLILQVSNHSIISSGISLNEKGAEPPLQWTHWLLTLRRICLLIAEECCQISHVTRKQ